MFRTAEKECRPLILFSCCFENLIHFRARSLSSGWVGAGKKKMKNSVLLHKAFSIFAVLKYFYDSVVTKFYSYTSKFLYCMYMYGCSEDTVLAFDRFVKKYLRFE